MSVSTPFERPGATKRVRYNGGVEGDWRIKRLTLTITGSFPRSRSNSTGSSSLMVYSSVANSFPRYEMCLSLHSHGYSGFRSPLESLWGMISGCCKATCLIRILRSFEVAPVCESSPSRNHFVPMSSIPCRIRPCSLNKALKDSLWNCTASRSRGCCDRSFGGFWKRFCRRTVSNSTDHGLPALWADLPPLWAEMLILKLPQRYGEGSSDIEVKECSGLLQWRVLGERSQFFLFVRRPADRSGRRGMVGEGGKKKKKISRRYRHRLSIRNV